MQTEPPLNPPENRENTAEIMFESFNIQGLYVTFATHEASRAHSLPLQLHRRTGRLGARSLVDEQ